MSRRLFILLLIGLCALAYANSFRNGFHFDDYRLIRSSDRAHRTSGWKTLLQYDRFRPLPVLSFALNYRAGGEDPFGYHVLNFSLHTLCVILFYFLLRRSGQQLPYPMAAAALMAVHPLNTEAVTYIAGRSIVLCAVFYLSAMLCADSYFRNGKRIWSLLYFLCFFLAALAKEEAMTIPIAALLYNAMLFGKESVQKNRHFHLLGFVPVLAGVMLRISTALPSSPYSLSEYIVAQPLVWMRYIKLALYPVGQNVDPDVRIPAFGNLSLWLALLSVCLIAYFLIRTGRRNPIFGFWGVWFFINLLPSSVVPLNDVMAEHRIYLSLFGFCAVAGWAIFAAGKRSSAQIRIPAVILLILVSFYAITTLQRNRVWRNEFTLWYDAALKSPAKPRTHLNLAGAYIEKGAYDLAIRELHTAQRLGGDAPQVYSGLGICAYQKQDWKSAEKYFRKGLQLDSQHVDSRAGLALALYRQRKFQEALPHLIAVYPKRPESPVIVTMLGNCYLRAGLLDEAQVMADRLRILGYASQAKNLEEQIGKMNKIRKR